MKNKVKLPIFLIFLDGVGVAILVVGILSAQGIDLGLPVLDSIWHFLIVLGFCLMLPMVVWVVQTALRLRKEKQTP